MSQSLNNELRDDAIEQLYHEVRRLRSIVSILWEQVALIAQQVFEVRSFTSELESAMPFAAGQTAVIDFTPQPVGVKLAEGDIPTITSSDPTNAPVTADSTGLVGTVVLSATAPAGDYTFTCTYTNPDGVVAFGTYVGTIVQDVTGFTSSLVS